jgi:hypothetical protein
MFADTLLESGPMRRTGRGWATTASFSLQALVLAALVVLPSLYPEVMAHIGQRQFRCLSIQNLCRKSLPERARKHPVALRSSSIARQ